MTASTIARDTAAADGNGAGKAPRVPRDRMPLWRKLVRDRLLWLFLVPGLAYFLIFHLGAAFGMVIAFTDYWPGITLAESNLVGVETFQKMFGDADFWHAVLNTVEISLLQLIFYFPVPLGLALLLHSLTSTTIKRLVQNVVYLPHFISWVIVVALFQQILGGAGVVNGFLADHGLHTVDIIGNPDAFKPLLIAQVIWKDSGWGTIIFLAALAQVDDTLYEASAMDGAGPWRRFWHVTLPSIRSVVVLLLVLRLGEVLSVGFEQLLLQRDAVGPAAGEIIDTYVYYKSLGGGGDFPLAAAAGIFKGVIGAILVYAANKVAHRLGEQGVYR
ncbi:ABC transporter permease [Hamadaea flava]|uniref:ABC transporter permease n=1 Tax=Hamadaea flava TaxID=1742688 RepID=UPI0023DFFF67